MTSELPLTGQPAAVSEKLETIVSDIVNGSNVKNFYIGTTDGQVITGNGRRREIYHLYRAESYIDALKAEGGLLEVFCGNDKCISKIKMPIRPEAGGGGVTSFWKSGMKNKEDLNLYNFIISFQRTKLCRK